VAPSSSKGEINLSNPKCSFFSRLWHSTALGGGSQAGPCVASFLVQGSSFGQFFRDFLAPIKLNTDKVQEKSASWCHEPP